MEYLWHSRMIFFPLYYTVGSHQLSILYISIPISQFFPPSSLPLYPRLLCLRLYFCFTNRLICTIFSRFHIYALTYQYDICFSLSDCLRPVGHCLGPSTSLQVAPLYNLYYIKVTLKNAFQYTVGTDKYTLTPLIQGTQNSQIHRIRKCTGRCWGLRAGGRGEGMGSQCLMGTEFWFSKMNNSLHG